MKYVLRKSEWGFIGYSWWNDGGIAFKIGNGIGIGIGIAIIGIDNIHIGIIGIGILMI